MYRQHRLRADINWLSDAEDAELGRNLDVEQTPPSSWRLGASMCVAVVVTTAAFAAPAYMSGLDPMNLTIPPRDGLDMRTTRQVVFADGDFQIEPAAGPVGVDQLAACRTLLADELQGEFQR